MPDEFMQPDSDQRPAGAQRLLRGLRHPWQLLSQRLLPVLLLVLLAAPAAARDYSVEIRVADEGELRQLSYDGLIDDEELELLLGLLESPVDLNRAGNADLQQLPEITPALARGIIEERDDGGPFKSLLDLAARVEGITPTIKEQLSSFVLAYHDASRKVPVRGHVDFLVVKGFEMTRPIADDYPALGHSAAQLGYDKWPAIALGANISIKDWLTIGLAGVAQEGLKAAVYDPASGDIYGSYGTPVFRPYMGYARVIRPTGQAVVGSYHLHYGQGLVLSTLGGRDRHGFYLRRSIGRGSDRIREFDGLLGAAARTGAVRVGPVRLDMSSFISFRGYDQYISYIGLAGGEQLDAATVEVDAPQVWVDGKRASYMTIPTVFRVGLLGGNFTARFNRRTQLGFTGYGAFIDRTALDGVEEPNTLLIRQRWPSDPGFGAIGINGRVGVGLLNVEGEWGLWLAGAPANALFVRAELEPAWGVVALSLRHYDTGYGNPMTRAEAATDRYAGNSARNEQGVRLAATLRPDKRLRVSTRIDLSRNILFKVTDFSARLSVTGKPLDWLQLRLFTFFVNQNVLVNGREQRYGGEYDEDVFGLPESDALEFVDGSYERAGEHIRLGGSVRFQYKRKASFLARYSHTWDDTGKEVPQAAGACGVVRQQSHRLRLQGRIYPSRSTRLVASFGYNDDDIRGSKGSRGLEGYLQVQQSIKERVDLRLRGRLGRYLPDAPQECDYGSSSTYSPDDYDLRHFGELLFTARVKF